MANTPKALVVGAPRTGLQYGLFSAVPLRPEGDGRWINGVTWETQTCAPAGGRGGPNCDPDVDIVGLPKDLADTVAEVGEADSFIVWGYWRCNVLANGPVEAQERAEQHLLSREEQAVEEAFWDGTYGQQPNLRNYDGNTEVILDGAAQSIPAGLAYLEYVIATQYGSQGVIHMTRGMALQAKKYLETRNGRLYTFLGTPVVAGTGYSGEGPDGQPATGGGQSWAFATPAMFGYQGSIITSSGRPGDLLDRADNMMTAIAERPYLLGFDPCGIVAVLLDQGGSSGSGSDDLAADVEENTAAIAALTTTVNGKADAGHKHAGADITSGTIPAARISGLPASAVSSGTFADARIPALATSKITGLDTKQTEQDGRLDALEGAA